MPILAEHGRDACAIYLGNPGAHSIGPMIYNRALITALGTSNRFSASTVDQRPKEMSAAMMFGSVAVPVPDLDHTDFLLMLGANPYASNGSLCTAPDFPGRLEAIQARGGTVVVVDPRRSETAAKADQHLAIRPGTDAHLLAAIAHVLVADGLADTSRLAGYTNGLDEFPALLAPYTPEAVAPACGVDADAHPHARPRPRRRPDRGRVRPDRHVHPGVRHARLVARRRGEPAVRQPRPARRRDVPEGCGGPAVVEGQAG